jgi:hypothetical protein
MLKCIEQVSTSRRGPGLSKIRPSVIDASMIKQGAVRTEYGHFRRHMDV